MWQTIEPLCTCNHLRKDHNYSFLKRKLVCKHWNCKCERFTLYEDYIKQQVEKFYQQKEKDAQNS